MFYIFAFFLAGSPAHTNVTKPIELGYVSFQDNTGEHQFWIEEASPGKMRLKFKDGKKQIQAETIPEGKATLLAQKITKVYWDSQFKKSIKPSECSVYARVRIPGEKIAPVCTQQGKPTGWLYGTLVEMKSYFR